MNKIKRIAVFPGSFDPITLGHEDLIKRAAPLFDKVIVAIGLNSSKKNLFPLNKRMLWLEEVFKEEENIVIDSYEGLTVNFCNKMSSSYIIRGLRSSSDFEYEKQISQLNHIIGSGIETVFLISKPEFSHISSSIVREILKNNGDVSQLVPRELDL